jgi:hypothetical protein
MRKWWKADDKKLSKLFAATAAVAANAKTMASQKRSIFVKPTNDWTHTLLLLLLLLLLLYLMLVEGQRQLRCPFSFLRGCCLAMRRETIALS